MIDSVTDLGKSLATEYHHKMTQWSELEFNFIADDLAASYGLATDIMRLEEGWQAFNTVVQNLQTDLVPQDLLAFSMDTNSVPEQQLFQSEQRLLAPEQPLPSPVIRKGNYPFTFPVVNGVANQPIDFPAGEEQLPAEIKSADNTNLPTQDNEADFPKDKRISSPRSKSEDLSFGFPGKSIQHDAGNISPASDTKIIKTPASDLFNPVQNQDLLSLHNLTGPIVHKSLQTPAEEMPAGPDTSSDSIWTQPLQSLGDFATLIGHPVTEKSAKVKPPGPLSLIAIPDNDSESAELNPQSEDESGWLPKSMGRPGNPKSDFEMLSPASNTGYFQPARQTPDSKPETQSFVQETKGYIPDTDDLLEALTDRILRDFHRYYP